MFWLDLLGVWDIRSLSPGANNHFLYTMQSLILNKNQGILENKSTMYNQHLPRISLQPRRQLPLTNLQLGTNLIKTMHPIQILDQTLIIDKIVFSVSIALPFLSPVIHHTPTLHRRRLPVISRRSRPNRRPRTRTSANARSAITHTRSIRTIRARPRPPRRKPTRHTR